MFTADQARALLGSNKHARELASNETALRNAASISDPREVAHHRKMGVLVFASNAAQMQADLKARGFTISPANTPGFLRAHW